MKFKSHNPIAEKRWRRFREKKRACFSLWILIGLYLCSLLAEFICNGQPLFLRFNNKSYFPAFKFYPECRFLIDGEDTRPNYRQLNKHSSFSDNAENYMIFAPVRFGPNENVDPQSLRSVELVTLKFASIPHVGRINVSIDNNILKARSADYFFQVNDKDFKSIKLSEHWQLPDPMLKGIERRFKNLNSPAISLTLTNKINSNIIAKFSLAKFKSRSKNPSSVRLVMRELNDNIIDYEIKFNQDLAIDGDTPKIWNELEQAKREELLELVKLRFAGHIESKTLIVNDSKYRLDIDKHDISWPYPPVKGHWFGIDSAGRDVFARMLYGLRISMSFGFIIVGLSMVLGALVGAFQGYYGGKIDITTQRIIEIWSALPFLYIMILMGSIYGRSFTLLLCCYGMFNWIGISYYVRAEFLRLRKQAFVDAARCLGLSDKKIVFRHILPNSITPIITFFPFALVGAIGSLAALDYLGFGLPPPTASWGELLHQAQQFRWAWWLILYPSLALFIVMLLGVFIGEGLRDAYDPRPLSRIE